MPVVDVKGVSKTYPTLKGLALDNITLSVEQNELFGVIGPDGSGKTSLFRILTSLLLPDGGTASVCGFDVVRDYKKIRNIVGYMPGRFSLYHDLSVQENLEFFATVFGTTIDENYHLIKDIYSHIEPFKKRLAGKLSGGMKQKLALSCALIHAPQVLILDEPTTGVDAVSRREFWEMLKKLKQQNITILVSTPYMDEAGLCDRVALIQNGKIMQINTPQQIINQYPFPLYAIRSSEMFKLITDISSLNQTHSVFLFGQDLHYTDKAGKINTTEFTNLLAQRGHSHVQVREIEANIEDCFMELMTR